MTIAAPNFGILLSERSYVTATLHYDSEFNANIKAIKLLLGGDVSVIPYLYEQYKYIAVESCRYVYYKMSTSIPFEDVEQQAHLELVNTLTTRVPHSGKEWLAEINENEGHEPCLGIRPYLISSVRKMLKLYVVEGTGVIRIHKVIYEKKHIEEHGEPNPPKCISNTAKSREGEEFQLPGSVPVEHIQPVDNAIANEIKEALCLEPIEAKILEMRLDGRIIEEIAKEVNKPRSTLFRMIQDIQARYGRWVRKNG